MSPIERAEAMHRVITEISALRARAEGVSEGEVYQRLPSDVQAALVGGYAAILHGLERTILDVDLCLYTPVSRQTGRPTRY